MRRAPARRHPRGAAPDAPHAVGIIGDAFAAAARVAPATQTPPAAPALAAPERIPAAPARRGASLAMMRFAERAPTTPNEVCGKYVELLSEANTLQEGGVGVFDSSRHMQLWPQLIIATARL